ncbi:DUF4349 domain-containing protein [Mucilaginibacter sp. CSA2-8R]|uniref:DUF4349 domain-containing protein n=1 Tax=Mucilaginibacter sp. CSA2-8R TaxID=3141542 RepID=UPI00315CC78A
MKMSNLLLLLAVLCLFAACKGRGSYESELNKQTADSANTVSLDSMGAKLVKTAQVDMKVKDAAKVSEEIVRLTTVNYHGMVMNHHLQSEELRSEDMKLSGDSLQRVTVYHTTAAMTVKVPPAALNQFMSDVSKLSLHVNVRRMDIEDKTFDYLTFQLYQNNRKDLADQQKAGKVKFKDPTSVLSVNDDLANEKVNNVRINHAILYSVVDLALTQNNTVSIEHIANDDPTVYQIPFLQRMAFALSNGWSIFADFIIGISNLWVLLLLGAVVWLLLKYYKVKLITAVKSI